MFPNLRFSLRILIKHPGFTVVALLSLALGIGVNSVIFSLVDGAMLRPLPFSDVGRVVRVFAADDRNPRQTFSYPVYQRLREDSRAFSGLTAVEGAGGLLRGEDRSEMLTAEQVSPDYFGVLGVRPLLGRAFDETGALSEPVAVISHSLWQRRFGGDRQVVGTSIVFQERLFTIVGVAPEGFGGTQRVMMADVWYPVEATADRAATMSEERRPFGLI
ncbi:MAG: ABC transporter permease, partial [Vicinamibacterales bacterium]|nr:ABC transporter permease [Vicinamibacterales bacterium]